MIRALGESGAPARIEADVHVIGGGTAGLVLACRLAKAGKRVVVSESGGRRQDGEVHPLSRVEQAGALYAGAELGRARCLGGTSTIWGGALVPLLKADFAGWPDACADWLRFIPEVETLFGLPGGPYDRPDLAGKDAATGFVPRLAKWPPFRLRNVATALGTELEHANGPEIWLDATATGFAFLPGGSLDTVTVSHPSGRTMQVSAPETVIAAGAIEATRLLLIADRAAGGQAFGPANVLGRYFHDHLSAPVAQVTPANPRAWNRTFGFRFEAGGMRNLRFEPDGAAAAPGFAHFGHAESEGGFAALRDLYRGLQQRRLPGPALGLRLARSAPWIARAAWWRFVEHRLLAPDGASAILTTVIEQEPAAASRITLSDSGRDMFGQPLARIDWRVSDADRARFTAFTGAFLDWWQGSALAPLGTITPRLAGEAEAELEAGGGIYHPCGSTRIGSDATSGVVFADLRCIAVPNLSVLATSVFPRAGGANPTMTLLCAAMALGERLGSAR